MFEEEFDKMANRMQRDAMRRGGPMDAKISVPCKSCGDTTEVAMRRFTHKQPPRCPHCDGYLDEEVARQIITSGIKIAAQRLRHVLKKR